MKMLNTGTYTAYGFFKKLPLLLVIISTLSLSACGRVHEAKTPTRVDVILFPLASGLPLYTALKKGFYREEGLEVSLTRTPNSTFLIKNLAENQFQVALASLDNFIAYQENQHLTPKREDADLFAFMGLSQTNLSLVVAPEIKAYSDLKGKSIAVDAKTTGFAFVLLKMLEMAGLEESDYQLQSVGSTDKRWRELKQGNITATLLTGGYTKQAINAGFNVLDTSLDVLKSYQGAVLSSNSTWANQQRDELQAFTRATLKGLSWLQQKENETEAADILSTHVRGLSPQAAVQMVRKLSSENGLNSKGTFNDAGVRTVIALRNQYGQPRKALSAPAAYINMRYLQSAWD